MSQKDILAMVKELYIMKRLSGQFDPFMCKLLIGKLLDNECANWNNYKAETDSILANFMK